ncbi:MAG: hypothetical protein JXB30_15655 [Anaerolineae bacterium]|nr:hypothetical protein [Anaerolineae bacterium]
MVEKKKNTAKQSERKAKISSSVRKHIRRLKAQGRHEEALAIWRQERARRDS